MSYIYKNLVEDASTFDIRALPDLDSKVNESERKRRQITTHLGIADPVFCPSCGKSVGFAAPDSSCIILCRECQIKYPDGLPLPLTENIAIPCECCRKTTKSIPRDLYGKVVFYCDDCEKKMESKPPLQIVVGV